MPLEPDEFVELVAAGLGVLVAVLGLAAGAVAADEAVPVPAAAVVTVAVEAGLAAPVVAAGAA